jgi:predicted proteasome-type protease
VLDNFGINAHMDAQLVVTPVVVFNGVDPLPAAGATYVAYYNDGSDFECPSDRWVLRQITAGNLTVQQGQKFNVLYTVQPL